MKNSGVAEKETVNEYRKDMMDKAIKKIGALKQADYDKQVGEFDTFLAVKAGVMTPTCGGLFRSRSFRCRL